MTGNEAKTLSDMVEKIVNLQSEIKARSTEIYQLTDQMTRLLGRNLLDTKVRPFMIYSKRHRRSCASFIRFIDQMACNTMVIHRQIPEFLGEVSKEEAKSNHGKERKNRPRMGIRTPTSMREIFEVWGGPSFEDDVLCNGPVNEGDQ